MNPERRAALGRRFLAWSAAAAGAFYLVWNALWVSSGHVPPSILQWFTGVPVSTTGLTRSALAALRGDIAASVSWNAFLVPILALLLVTADILIRRRLAGARLVIPGRLARLWLVVLAAAWIVKLAQGPAWW